MSPSSAQIIANLLSSDTALSPSEQAALLALLDATPPSNASALVLPALLLTQKETAGILGVDRTTVWRLTTMGVLRPTEISPGMFRYQRSHVEALSRNGYRHLLKSRHTLAA